MKSESGRVRGDITNMLGGKPPRTSGINSSTTMCRRRGGGGGREEWGREWERGMEGICGSQEGSNGSVVGQSEGGWMCRYTSEGIL